MYPVCSCTLVRLPFGGIKSGDQQGQFTFPFLSGKVASLKFGYMLPC
jgi:hypothetical protein